MKTSFAVFAAALICTASAIPTHMDGGIIPNIFKHDPDEDDVKFVVPREDFVSGEPIQFTIQVEKAADIEWFSHDCKVYFKKDRTFRRDELVPMVDARITLLDEAKRTFSVTGTVPQVTEESDDYEIVIKHVMADGSEKTIAESDDDDFEIKPAPVLPQAPTAEVPLTQSEQVPEVAPIF